MIYFFLKLTRPHSASEPQYFIVPMWWNFFIQKWEKGLGGKHQVLEEHQRLGPVLGASPDHSPSAWL